MADDMSGGKRTLYSRYDNYTPPALVWGDVPEFFEKHIQRRTKETDTDQWWRVPDRTFFINHLAN